MDFETLQHSVFLQALGSAILNSLWQGFIMWLIYETINAAYRTASAKFKNNVSTILLFFAFAWFLTSFISKFFYTEKIISLAALPVNNVTQLSPHNSSFIQTILSYAINSLPYLSVAYIFLLFFLMAKLFAAYRYVYFIANKRLLIPPAELQTFANKVAKQMRITKKIGVWISHHIDVPATIGFIKPVILIPVASINNLSASQLEAIILHELSHIKRNDYIINIITSVIETILFFNPFILLLSKVIKRERENCCDDFVLQYSYDPHSYASALLCLEKSRRNNLQLAIGAVSGKKQLLSRIKRITDCHVVSKQFNYGQKLLALLLVTGIFCSVAWLSPEKKSVSAKVLVKGNKSLSNYKTSIKTSTLVYKKIENSEKSNVKFHNQKNQSLNFTENNMEDIPVENFTITKDENTGDQNVLTARAKSEFATGAILKQPRFFFDGNNIKLPSVINIPNFPFQNMSFNINLSKIDLNKLNENLKQAYKEINSLDWNKIQNDINENFSKANVENLSAKENADFFKEKALATLLKLKSIKGQQQYDSKEFSQQVHRKMFLQDSLSKKELTLIDENNQKVQQVYKKWKKQFSRNIPDNYYFISDNNFAPDNNCKEEPTECPKKKSVALIANKKNIKIIIDHIPGLAKGLNEKKSFQYLFKENTEKYNQQNTISIEVSETP